MLAKYRRLLIIGACCLLCILGLIVLHIRSADRSGWQTDGTRYYYLDPRGQRVTGWHTIDGSRYYFGPDCAMRTGWLLQGGRQYYLAPDGKLHTGWLDSDVGRHYFDPDGALHTGWLETAEGLCYLDGGTLYTGVLHTQDRTYLLDDTGMLQLSWTEIQGQRAYRMPDGTPATGWVTDDLGRWYLDSSGLPRSGWLDTPDGTYYFPQGAPMHTGWLTQGEYSYYFRDDGTMATSPTVIDGLTHYFTPGGIHVMLVNRRNPLPENFEITLAQIDEEYRLDQGCVSAAKAMLAECIAHGFDPKITSAYRSREEQQETLDNRIRYYMNYERLTREEATQKALLSVAVPGTSEHHLGLALDVYGDTCMPWLEAHCWEYGFILRYPQDKTHITGIIYEPWHFRYVGVEIAMELKDSGLCLEEYLDAVNPGT